MFEASYRGKTMPEDVFTSNVFGLLNLLPDRYLTNLLQMVDWQGQCNKDAISISASVEAIEYWPNFGDFGIPDLLLRINGSDAKHAIVIEVKHGSGAGHLQLDRYWVGLEQYYRTYKRSLVFLTHDRLLPSEVHDSLHRLHRVGQNACIGWLSWYDVFKWASLKKDKTQTSCEYNVLEELMRHLIYNGFRSFISWDKLDLLVDDDAFYKRIYECEIREGSVEKIYTRHYFRSCLNSEIHEFYSCK
jgi:hypothetical protein